MIKKHDLAAALDAWRALTEAQRSSALKRFDDVLGMDMPEMETAFELLRAATDDKDGR